MKVDALERAIQIAVKAHAGQLDKGNSPYILHPLRVMHSMNEINEKIVAVLHDVIEDTSVTLDDLVDEGFSQVVICAVDCITKRKDEEYKDYLERVKKSDIARVVKLSDLEDNCNLTRIIHPTEKDYERIKKYKESVSLLKLVE